MTSPSNGKPGFTGNIPRPGQALGPGILSQPNIGQKFPTRLPRGSRSIVNWPLVVGGGIVVASAVLGTYFWRRSANQRRIRLMQTAKFKELRITLKVGKVKLALDDVRTIHEHMMGEGGLGRQVISSPDNRIWVNRKKFMRICQRLLFDGSRLFSVWDIEKTKKIDYIEFMHALIIFSGKSSKEDKLRTTFQLYDVQQRDFLDCDDLTRVLLCLARAGGFPVSERQARAHLCMLEGGSIDGIQVRSEDFIRLSALTDSELESIDEPTRLAMNVHEFRVRSIGLKHAKRRFSQR
eukprot:176839_1